MKHFFESLSKKEKMVIAILVGWTFIHFIFLLISDGNKRVFWPFDDEPILVADYDKIEFLVYALSPILIFSTYLFLTKSKRTESTIKNEYKPSFDLKTYIVNNKRFFLSYFIWVGLQVVFLLISNCTWEKGMYYPQLFFPFSGYPTYFYDNEKNPFTLLIYTYSYSEFLVYTLLPLGIKYCILLFNNKRTINNLSQKEPRDLYFKKGENISETSWSKNKQKLLSFFVYKKGNTPKFKIANIILTGGLLITVLSIVIYFNKSRRNIITVESSPIADFDGNIYPTIQIGEQIWMAKNLNVSHFRNGDTIPEIKSNEEWKKADDEKRPAWCYYNNDSLNGALYGKLYNWYAVNDPRGLAPINWHIPSDNEWKELTTYLSSTSEYLCNIFDYLKDESVISNKLKDKKGWDLITTSQPESGFNALPAGYRFSVDSSNKFDSAFNSLKHDAYWWSSSNVGGYAADYFYMYNFTNNTYRGNTPFTGDGKSIRCIKNKEH